MIPQQIIDDQAREIERLREDLRRSEAERQRLRRENEKLKDELEAARRRGVAPGGAVFARDDRGAAPRGPAANRARRMGGRRIAVRPAHVDETYEAPLPRQCPALRAARCAASASPRSIRKSCRSSGPSCARFASHIGHCRQCHRRVQGRHPLQTSDALGAAAVQLGPQAVALAVLLNKDLGLPYGEDRATLCASASA